MSTEPTQLQVLKQQVLDTQDLTDAIPASLPPEDIVAATLLVVEELHKNYSDSMILTAMLARLHWLARNDHRIIEAAGCADIGEYQQKILTPKGRSKATMYRVGEIFEHCPLLTPREYQIAGYGKLKAAIDAMRGREMSDKQKYAIVDMAMDPNESVKQYRAKIVKEVPAANPGYSSILIEGNADQIEELRSLMGDTDYQRVAGTNTQIGVLLAALHAFVNEINAQ